MKQNQFPPGWDEESIRELIAYHESLLDDEEIGDEEETVADDAAFEYETQTTMTVPVELVPTVRELIATYQVG